MLPLSFGTYRAPPNKCPTSAKYGRCLAIITAVDKIDIMRIGNWQHAWIDKMQSSIILVDIWNIHNMTFAEVYYI